MTGRRGKQRQLGLPDLTGRTAQTSARPLPARQPSPCRAGEWYAVSEDGGSALRIRSGLHIGETERGTLVFDDALEVRRWVVLRIAPDGACAVEAVGERHRLVDEAGDPHSRYALSPGATLVFPGNTLRISEHIARPAQPGPRLTVEAGGAPVGAGAAPAAEPAEDCEVAAVSADAGGAGPQTAAGELQPPETEAEPASARAGALGRWKVGAGIAACGLLVGGLLLWPGPGDPSDSPSSTIVGESPVMPVGSDETSVGADETSVGADETSVGAGQTPVRAGETPVRAGETPVVPVQIPPLARRTVAAPLTAIDLDDLPPRRLLPAPAAATDAEPLFAAELARARELLEAGYITYPPNDNAVAVLSRIMAREADHPEALALLGECTSRLIDAAIDARQQGMQYQARNLLEEVRGFNPDNERANRLWQEWMR